MRKIAFVVTQFDGGHHTIIKKLIKEQFFIDVYCCNSRIENYKGVNSIIKLNTRVNFKKVETIIAFSDELKNAIMDKNYDVVFSFNIPISFGNVFFEFNSIVHRQKILKNPIERFLFRHGHSKRINFYKNWYTPEHGKIFVVSEELKKDYSQNCNIPADRIFVAHPGFACSGIKEIKKYIPGKEPFVFGLSALGFNRKGGYVFLKTLGILKKKGVDFKARIIYPQSAKNNWVKFLVKLYNIEDKVEFLGFQNGMQDFYKSIHCLVMPSVHEAFGMVAIEAMVNYRPCIISSCSGAADVVRDGINGFTFDMDKNAAKNLADRMEFVCSNYNNLTKCIQAGYETASAINWDQFSSKIVNELKTI